MNNDQKTNEHIKTDFTAEVAAGTHRVIQLGGKPHAVLVINEPAAPFGRLYKGIGLLDPTVK
jgi:hypothetical protein